VPIPQQEQKCIVIVAGEESASEHNMAMVARAETKIFVGKSNLPRNGLRSWNRKERKNTAKRKDPRSEKICFRTIHGHNPKYQ